MDGRILKSLVLTSLIISHLSPGYLNDPTKTAEAIDADGWLHTGDIGIWESNGGLKIVDRKKHIFKLAQVSLRIFSELC